MENDNASFFNRHTRSYGQFERIYADIDGFDETNQNEAPDSYWISLRDSLHELIPFSYWQSLGRGNQYAVAMMNLQIDLEKITRKLFHRRLQTNENAGDDKNCLGFYPSDWDGEFLPILLNCDAKLHSRWMMLFHVMGASKWWDLIAIVSIELPKVLMDMMEGAFKNLQKFGSKNSYKIILDRNHFGTDGILALTKILEANSSIESLVVQKNSIDFDSAVPFSKAIKRHESLASIMLQECGIGKSTRTLSTILTACSDLKSLLLIDNGIRSRGAAAIANFLETNPKLENLSLDGNQLTNDDAALFSRALRSNRHLKWFDLENNDISESGVEALSLAVFDTSSLNSIADSNHTCLVDGLPGLTANYHWNIHLEGHRKFIIRHKIVMALVAGERDSMNLHYLNHVPLELIPEVLERFQMQVIVPLGKRGSDVFMHVPVNLPLWITFEILRSWKLPLLFMGSFVQARNPLVQDKRGTKRSRRKSSERRKKSFSNG